MSRMEREEWRGRVLKAVAKAISTGERPTRDGNAGVIDALLYYAATIHLATHDLPFSRAAIVKHVEAALKAWSILKATEEN